MRSKKYFCISALASLLLSSSVSVAGPTLTPQAFFNRCYVQLTSQPVPLNSPLMAQVKAGTITALDACKQVLAKAKLSDVGELANTNDKEAKAVLNTFYSFHRTWFPSNNLDTIDGYDTDETHGTVDIYDTTEPALAVTYTMFGKNQRYSDTLTRSSGVTAVRIENSTLKTRLGWVGTHPGRFMSNKIESSNGLFQFRSTSLTTPVSSNAANHVATYKSMPLISVGDLVGIKPTSNTFNVANVSLKPLNGVSATENGAFVAGLNYSYDFYKTYGGGVLGTPIYLMQYLGHGMNTKFNGQSKVARRWSQQNMETFLCKNLPALRESDVAAMVDVNSTAPFRNASSCIMCHATLDPMAYTARNLTTGAFDYVRNYTTDGTTTAYFRNAVAITSYKNTLPSVGGWPSEPVTNFHIQNPTGRLYFRTFSGALIDQNLTDINSLGNALANTDDYYLCAAKRYFEFMTGISVELFDKTDPGNASKNAALTAQDLSEYRYIQTLAKDLQTRGSVTELIESIMGSTYYSQTNFR